MGRLLDDSTGKKMINKKKGPRKTLGQALGGVGCIERWSPWESRKWGACLRKGSKTFYG